MTLDQVEDHLNRSHSEMVRTQEEDWETQLVHQ